MWFEDKGIDLRKDFLKLGFYLLIVGFAIFFLALEHEGIYRFLRSTEVGLWALGAIVCIAGAIYLFVGLIQNPVTVKRSSLGPLPAGPQPQPKTMTGPGWHCSWCWGPLPQGATYCPTCGKEIP